MKAADSNWNQAENVDSPGSAAEQALFTSSSQEIRDEPGPLVHEQSSAIASRPASCLDMGVTIPAMEQCLLPSEESNQCIGGYLYMYCFLFIYYYYYYSIN